MPLPVHIERELFFEAALESARLKGSVLKFDDFDLSIGEFLSQYDWVIAIFPDATTASNLKAIEVRNTQKESGYMRCNSIPCEDERTALKLKQICDSAGS